MSDKETKQPEQQQFQYYPPMHQGLEEDEIDLMELWGILMAKKKLIITSTFVTIICAIAYALLATPVYRAEVLMSSASTEGKSSGLSALAGQFGGLANMAGISLGGGSSLDAHIATVSSRQFAEKFIINNKLKPIIFYKNWDDENNKWIVKEPGVIAKLFPAKEKTNTNLLPGEPSNYKAVDAFTKLVSVSTDKKTGLITLAVNWQDPELAAEWANKLVAQANISIRNQAVNEAQTSIKFLNNELNKTSLVNARQVFFNLIEEQTKTIMLANVRDQFAFKVIDPAVAPEERIKPKRKLIVVVGAIAGLMLSIFAVFFLNFIDQQRNKDEDC